MAEIDALKKAHVCRRLIKKCFFFFDTNWKNALQGKYKYKLVRGTSLGEQHTSQTTKVWSPRYVVRLFPFPTIFGTQSMMRTSCFLKTCEEFLFSYGHFCNLATSFPILFYHCLQVPPTHISLQASRTIVKNYIIPFQPYASHRPLWVRFKLSWICQNFLSYLLLNR